MKFKRLRHWVQRAITVSFCDCCGTYRRLQILCPCCSGSVLILLLFIQLLLLSLLQTFVKCRIA